MSFSGSSTLPARRKRTVSERVIENGDPLVIKKKAREAAEQASSLAPSTTKKTTQVCFFFFQKDHLTFFLASANNVLHLELSTTTQH